MTTVSRRAPLIPPAGRRISRRRRTAAAAIGALSVGVLVVAAVAAFPSGAAERERARDLAVSPTGSDAGSCTRSDPCRTFAAAYRRARPGAVVTVRGGRYPEQQIPLDTTKGGRAVVFRPEPGELPVVEGEIDVYGSWLEIRDLAARSWYAHPGASRLTFRNLDVERFYVTSASEVRVLGGDIGPSVNKVSQIKADLDSAIPPRNVVLDGLLFHDYTRTDPAKHMECLHVMAVDGLVIRNSRFQRCSIFDVAFNEHGETNAMRRILVENNLFDRTLDGGHYALHFSSGDPCEALIRFNTFLQGASAECPPTGAGVRFESNILPAMTSRLCGRNGYRFDWNVYETGRRCGRHDRVARVQFLDRGSFDLRLARGAAAVGRGNPANAPARDLEGQLRPRRLAPDAGADQREPAALVPGRSIGSARLGAALRDVAERLGSPRAASTAGGLRVVRYRVPGGTLSVRVRDGRVVGVSTASSYYATAAGVGPGAPVTPSLARLPWSPCARAFRRAGRTSSTYYAPAGGRRGATVRAVTIVDRRVDACARP